MHLQSLWLFARGEVDQGAKRARDHKRVGDWESSINVLASPMKVIFRQQKRMSLISPTRL